MSHRERASGGLGIPLSIAIPLIVLAAAVASVTVLVATHRDSRALPGDVRSESASGFLGESLSPRRMAPGTGSLRNYDGEAVDLAGYRGKAVLVTFLYTRCPDVCPLMTAKLHATLEQLGPKGSEDVRIVAISVDPHHDNRVTVGQFLRLHGMTGRMEYLTGTAHQLGPVWEAWNVGSAPDSVNPELVAHSALVYGIGASGRLTTIYTEDFRPGQIVHDLPKLLES